MADKLTIEECNQVVKALSREPKPIAWELKPVYQQLADTMRENERLQLCLDPRRWTREMSDAWHLALPSLNHAFDAIKEKAETLLG